MNNKSIRIGSRLCPLLTGILLLFSGCSSENTPAGPMTSDFELTMELTKDYDDSAPFVDERLFYVTENTDSLSLEISLQLDGESGILEIADNNTGEALWSNRWNEAIEDTAFTTSLSFQKDGEYVLRFTGTKIEYAKVTVKSDSSLIKERTRPLKRSSAGGDGSLISDSKSGTFFNELTVTDKDIITSDFDVWLDGNEGVFLTIEAAQDLEATVHYTYTTNEKAGAVWGCYLNGADDKTSFELRAGTENVYGNFWTDETIQLKEGLNIFYISGSDISCKMHFEITQIDKTKVSYVSAFVKNELF